MIVRTKSLFIILFALFIVGCVNTSQIDNEKQIESYAEEYNIKQGATSNYFSGLGIKWYFDKNGPNLPKYKFDLFVKDTRKEPFVFAIESSKKKIDEEHIPFYSRFKSSDSFTFEQAIYKFKEKNLLNKEINIIVSFEGYSNIKDKELANLDYSGEEFLILKTKLPEVDQSLVAIDLDDVDLNWCKIEDKKQYNNCEDYLTYLGGSLHPKNKCLNVCLNDGIRNCKEECCEYLLEEYEHPPMRTNYYVYLVMYYNSKKSLEGALMCDSEEYNKIKKERNW